MKYLIAFLLVLTCVFSCFAKDTETAPTSVTAPASSESNSGVVSWGNDADEPQLKPMRFRDGLSFKQRREMGLTIKNIRRVIATGQASGDITEEMSRAEVSAYVADALLADNPAAFQDPSVDWDSILAFIERLIPLIMQIISMFS